MGSHQTLHGGPPYQLDVQRQGFYGLAQKRFLRFFFLQIFEILIFFF